MVVGAAARPGREREPGASMLAIQLSRQLSCAVRAQAHGLRHSESRASSSVSSRKQIQHLRGSCPAVLLFDDDASVDIFCSDHEDEVRDRALLEVDC